jgi:hypothetical protein
LKLRRVVEFGLRKAVELRMIALFGLWRAVEGCGVEDDCAVWTVEGCGIADGRGVWTAEGFETERCLEAKMVVCGEILENNLDGQSFVKNVHLQLSLQSNEGFSRTSKNRKFGKANLIFVKFSETKLFRLRSIDTTHPFRRDIGRFCVPFIPKP